MSVGHPSYLINCCLDRALNLQRGLRCDLEMIKPLTRELGCSTILICGEWMLSITLSDLTPRGSKGIIAHEDLSMRDSYERQYVVMQEGETKRREIPSRIQDSSRFGSGIQHEPRTDK